MKFDDIYNIYKTMIAVSSSPTYEVTVYLNESQHENLQQEIFKMQKQNLINYKSNIEFDVQMEKVKFMFKKR